MPPQALLIICRDFAGTFNQAALLEDASGFCTPVLNVPYGNVAVEHGEAIRMQNSELQGYRVWISD